VVQCEFERIVSDKFVPCCRYANVRYHKNRAATAKATRPPMPHPTEVDIARAPLSFVVPVEVALFAVFVELFAVADKLGPAAELWLFDDPLEDSRLGSLLTVLHVAVLADDVPEV